MKGQLFDVLYVRHISCPGTTKGFCRVVDCWQSFTYASLKSVRISKALAMVPHRIGTSGGAVSVGAVMLPRVNSMYHMQRTCARHLCVRWGPLVSEPRLQLLYNTSKETARDSASSILQMAIRNSDKTDGLVGISID